jgi:hypothetical protein
MKVHRQTLNQRVSDDDVRAILRRQMRTARPTNAATIRGLGIACGSCRLSRLRREVERELASSVHGSQVAPGSTDHPPTAPSFAIVPPNTGTGGEAPAPAAPTSRVAPPAASVSAGPNRPTLVGEPGRAAATPRSGHIRDLLGRIRCAAEAFWAAWSRRPFSMRKAPSSKTRRWPRADQPSRTWPQFVSSIGRKFGL